MVRISLVDDEANVRSAAAKTFDILQGHLGTKAVDQTIPTLLEALRQPGKGSGTALQALREVMSVRLTSSPIANCTLLIHERIHAGSGIYRLPRVDTHVDRDTHDRVQRSCNSISCYSCGECSEQEVNRHLELSRQGDGR